MTIYISLIAMALALALGLGVALVRMSHFRLLQWLAQAYLEIFRGIPQFVLLLWLYYGLAMVTGVNFEPVFAGILCLTVQYAGYLAEIYRAGIQSIAKGQWEAAYSLGLSGPQTFRYVIFPQALRIIIPPAANMFVGMLKDSSLVSVIGVTELIRQTQVTVSLTFRPFEFYTVAGLIYIALTFLSSRLIQKWERRLSDSEVRTTLDKKAGSKGLHGDSAKVGPAQSRG